MMKKTYVIRGGKIIEKQKAPPKSGAFFVMSDISPFTTMEGQSIGSRSQLRAYEQRTGMRQVGNDFNPERQS